MSIVEILTIIISCVAMIVAIITYNASKAIHNKQELKDTYIKMCDTMEEMLLIGSQNNIMNYKFDIENIFLIMDNYTEFAIKYNEYQKSISTQMRDCERAYIKHMSCLDFLNNSKKMKDNNSFIDWYVECINQYYHRLVVYYNNLSELLSINYKAKQGINLSDADNKCIDNFFENVKHIINESQALRVLKREMVGLISHISVKFTNAFSNNTKLINKINCELYQFVENLGIKLAINDKKFDKIRKIALDFGKDFDNYINEEKSDAKLKLSIYIQKSKEKSIVD